MNSVRIDKFLWAIRIFKTRSLATDACRMGRIVINNTPVKPSRLIEGNEILIVRKPPVTYTFKIIEPVENRVSAKLVTKYVEDHTPDNEKIKLLIKSSDLTGFRKKGTGRPTKKERRVIDKLKEGFNDHNGVV